jgi:hypothetical protein
MKQRLFPAKGNPRFKAVVGGLYEVTVPYQDSMGSISSFNARHGEHESIVDDIIWTLNSMRRHDNLTEFQFVQDIQDYRLIEVEEKH